MFQKAFFLVPRVSWEIGVQIVFIDKQPSAYLIVFYLICCYLGQYSIAVKRHQDQDNSYERKHFTGGLLTVSEL